MTLRSLAIGLQSIHMHSTGVDATGNERIRYYIQINDAYVVGCTLQLHRTFAPNSSDTQQWRLAMNETIVVCHGSMLIGNYVTPMV